MEGENNKCVNRTCKKNKINIDRDKVNFRFNMTNVNTGIIDAKVGQYVLVHAGCAIEVMEKDKAEELIELFGEIEELENEYK